LTKIEWTHRPGTKGVTWNPIYAVDRATGTRGWYCEHVSEGCRNCYAERMNAWRGTRHGYRRQDRDKIGILIDRKAIRAPLSWRKPRTAFVCSMTDLFGEFHDDTMILDVFATMALAPSHTFLVLTKRAKRMREYMATPLRKRAIAEAVLFVSEVCARAAGTWKARPSMAAFEAAFPRHARRHDDRPRVRRDGSPFPNVWLGVSVEDQATADERIPELLATPAAIRFVSYEPALGKVDFRSLHPGGVQVLNALDGVSFNPTFADWGRIDWLIAGGESGPPFGKNSGARPAHPDWFRAARDQCAAAGVPFFFKQWGEFGPNVLGVNDASMQRLGKGAAGANLDGREHRAWPDVGAGLRPAPTAAAVP
jgi:protein gp37